MVPDNGPYPWERIDLDHRETKYLLFQETPSAGKTRQWHVRSKSSGTLLGRIKWYGPWRQFVFFPEPTTLFNIGCLADINAFMTDAYTDWRFGKNRANKPVDAPTSG